MSKLLFICHFRRFLAQKSPNWLFLVKNRQIGDFCNANRQIGDKQQWHTLVSSQIIIWDQVYTQNPLVEVSKDVYTVVILLWQPPSSSLKFWMGAWACVAGGGDHLSSKLTLKKANLEWFLGVGLMEKKLGVIHFCVKPISKGGGRQTILFGKPLNRH